MKDTIYLRKSHLNKPQNLSLEGSQDNWRCQWSREGTSTRDTYVLEVISSGKIASQLCEWLAEERVGSSRDRVNQFSNKLIELSETRKNPRDVMVKKGGGRMDGAELTTARRLGYGCISVLKGVCNYGPLIWLVHF